MGRLSLILLVGQMQSQGSSERSRWNVRIRGGVKKKEGNVWKKGTFKNCYGLEDFTLEEKIRFFNLLESKYKDIGQEND